MESMTHVRELLRIRQVDGIPPAHAANAPRGVALAFESGVSHAGVTLADDHERNGWIFPAATVTRATG